MSDAAQSQPWSPRRWAALCLATFLAQLGFIFWLGERNPISPRPPAPAPELSLARNSTTEAMALQDPTLFALPRKQGFAGLAWLAVPMQRLPAVEFSIEPSWLELRPEQLGNSLQLLRDTNVIAGWRTPPMPEPELGWPPEKINEMAVPSRVRVVGTQPIPQLLTPIDLPSWPPKMLSPTDADLLTNSVVEVTIGVDGRPLNATLLSGSGSKPADDFAVNQARQARFDGDLAAANPTESAPDLLSKLRWCRLIFDWQTRPATNVTAATP